MVTCHVTCHWQEWMEGRRGGRKETGDCQAILGPLLPSSKSVGEHLCLTDLVEWKKIPQGMDVNWQSIMPDQGQGRKGPGLS